MKTLIVLSFAMCSLISIGQTKSLNSYKPNTEYENIHVQKIASDDFQSSFIIWVKESVAEHYHASHSENIYVISGKAIMTIEGKEVRIRKGDYLNIPEGTKHAVIEVLSHKPLKVLSIQSPEFDGRDRVKVEK